MSETSEGYQLIATRRFQKDLRRLSRQNQERVRRALPMIQSDPYAGHKLVVTEVGQYRRRVGAPRVLYDVEGRDLVLLTVRKREDAYKKL